MGEIYGIEVGVLNYIAAAIEATHAFSLVHDDLPGIDDDDFRRGKPSCHIKFGEAAAILAGDALLIFSFQLLSELKSVELNDNLIVFLINYFTCYIGAEGTICGEMLDIDSEEKAIPIKTVHKINRLKTGRLLQACLTLPAIASGITDKNYLNKLDLIGENLGIAFQIQDDLLPYIGDKAKIGKPLDSDVKNNKANIVSILGLENAIREKKKYYDAVLKDMEELNITAIKEIVQAMISRSY